VGHIGERQARRRSDRDVTKIHESTNAGKTNWQSVACSAKWMAFGAAVRA
jgi:hypothetical protein